MGEGTLKPMAEEQTQPQPENPQPGEAPQAAGEQPSAEATPQPAARPAAPPPPGQRVAPKAAAESLAQALAAAWDGIQYQQRYNFGDLEVTIAPADALEACRRCKADPLLAFDFLMCLTGTDYESYFEVVYHLWSYKHRHQLTIKARIEDYERPSVPSVTLVWKGADWHEREAAEMLGIDFPGHPNLVPLLLEEGVDERPLRKSHPLVPIYEDRPGIVRPPDAPEPPLYSVRQSSISPSPGGRELEGGGTTPSP